MPCDKNNKAFDRCPTTRMVPTTDDWFPTFEGGFVQGRVSKLTRDVIRISFWGNDDFGMELDLQIENTQERILTLSQWKDWLANLKNITQKDLRKLGFVQA